MLAHVESQITYLREAMRQSSGVGDDFLACLEIAFILEILLILELKRYAKPQLKQDLLTQNVCVWY